MDEQSAGSARGAPLPAPRGPLSRRLIGRLRTGSGALPAGSGSPSGALDDEDLQLALYICYELHYRGFDGVPEAEEWDPRVIAFRSSLETAFGAALFDEVSVSEVVEDAASSIRALADGGPSPLARFLELDASEPQFAEFLIQRSAYHLKEADPHSWAIPRLEPRAKAALVEIQSDEYGGGDPTWMHSRLFAGTMTALGLDPSYGAYIDRLPASTLATVNLMSLFGLHRRWRGAIVGHLALFEMTSVVPNRCYGNGLRRLGFGEEATRFFDEHVEADSVHEAVAFEMVRTLIAEEPSLAPDALFGAKALDLVESRAGDVLLRAWRAGGSSLRVPAEHLAAQVA
jgi:hypothetical protein